MSERIEIDAEFIREGDLIRKEYDPPLGRTEAVEYRSLHGERDVNHAPGKLYLLERPKPAVVLPTEPGLYSAPSGSQNHMGEWHTDHHEFYFLNTAGNWTDIGWGNPGASAELTRLRPVAEVAAEVLADAYSALKQIATFPTPQIDAAWAEVAAKYGVTK